MRSQDTTWLSTVTETVCVYETNQSVNESSNSMCCIFPNIQNVLNKYELTVITLKVTLSLPPEIPAFF